MAALERLATTLGVDPARLTPFAGYSEEQIDTLVAGLERAMEQEDAAFDQGLEEALRHVPALLRPTARKLVLGGGRRGE